MDKLKSMVLDKFKEIVMAISKIKVIIQANPEMDKDLELKANLALTQAINLAEIADMMCRQVVRDTEDHMVSI